MRAALLAAFRALEEARTATHEERGLFTARSTSVSPVRQRQLTGSADPTGVMRRREAQETQAGPESSPEVPPC